MLVFYQYPTELLGIPTPVEYVTREDPIHCNENQKFKTKMQVIKSTTIV